jgi:hypothetical protein
MPVIQPKPLVGERLAEEDAAGWFAALLRWLSQTKPPPWFVGQRQESK